MAGDADNDILGTEGIVAVWIGFAAHMFTTIYCMKAAMKHHSRSSRTFHYIAIVITSCAALSYLLMGLGALAGESTYWLHFAEWVVGTPLLLVDLGMLARMSRPEIAFICVADVLMIASGYAAEVATEPWRIWPVYCFSFSMFFVIMHSLLTHLQDVKAHPETNPAESKAFVFLSMWTVVFWSGFAILWTLLKTRTVNPDQAAIVYTLMDINAKDIFGLVIFGIRDVLGGEDTPLAQFAMAVVGVTREMRRHSVDAGVAQVLAVLSALESGGGAGASGASPALLKHLTEAAAARGGRGAKAGAGVDAGGGGDAGGGHGRDSRNSQGSRHGGSAGSVGSASSYHSVDRERSIADKVGQLRAAAAAATTTGTQRAAMRASQSPRRKAGGGGGGEPSSARSTSRAPAGSYTVSFREGGRGDYRGRGLPSMAAPSPRRPSLGGARPPPRDAADDAADGVDAGGDRRPPRRGTAHHYSPDTEDDNGTDSTPADAGSGALPPKLTYGL